MANKESLTPYAKGEERAKENGKRGGTASGIARRENKRLREIVQAALERIETDDENTEQMTNMERAALAQVRAAVNGDLKAFESVMKLAGEYVDTLNDKNKPEESNDWTWN